MTRGRVTALVLAVGMAVVLVGGSAGFLLMVGGGR